MMFGMSHWTRKHMCEIASTAQRSSALAGLTPDQHQTLGRAYKLARSVASGAQACSHDNVEMAVSLLCIACLPGLADRPPPRCEGRRDWRQPCDLIARNVLAECAD